MLDHVKNVICGFTGLSTDQFTEDDNLKGDVLQFDDNRLTYLAMSLRGYIINYNPNQTLLASEIRGTDVTVKSLAALVSKRIVSRKRTDP